MDSPADNISVVVNNLVGLINRYRFRVQSPVGPTFRTERALTSFVADGYVRIKRELDFKSKELMMMKLYKISVCISWYRPSPVRHT